MFKNLLHYAKYEVTRVLNAGDIVLAFTLIGTFVVIAGRCYAVVE